jgi:O-antigen/teichoic acid export membrane protein
VASPAPDAPVEAIGHRREAHAALRRLLSSSWVRGGTLVVGATLLWHLSNLVFNLVAARALGPSSYGELAAAVTLLYLASPLFVAVQTVASRIATACWARGDDATIGALLRFYAVRLAVAALLLTAGVVIASSALARFLRVSSGRPLAILACAFPFYVVSHMQRGVLQGALQFPRYAAGSASEALCKVVATVGALLVIWKTVDAAVLALVISAAAAVAVNWLLLSFLPRPRARLAPMSHPYRYSLTTLASLTLLAVLLSVDILAAKRYLVPHDAGLYASASLCGKIVFFATSCLSLVLFPLFSSQEERGLDARGPLSKGLALVGAMSVALVLVYALVPRAVIVPLFGDRFGAAAPELAWMGVAYALYGIAYLAAVFLLAQKRLAGTTALAVAALAQLAGFYAFHSTIRELIAVNVVVFACAAAALVLIALHRRAPASATALEPS